MNHTKLLESAECFVLSQPQFDEIDRDTLLRQTTDYLVNQAICSASTAHLFAVRAIANLLSKQIDAYVDIEHSSAKCVFVCIKGQRHACSINDLVKAIANQQEAT